MTNRYALAALLLCSAAAHAQSVVVKAPWVRATVAQQNATGAFMSISSAKGARLVEVRSAAAKSVELHEMKMQGDVMRMRPVDAIDLPAGKPVELKPGGYHVMLVDLARPLKEGDSVTLTLVVEGADRQRETIEVTAAVRALNPAAAGGHDHKH